MSALSPHVRETYEANKRELFDAMRAYHASEIAHKQDAIGMLTTVLTAFGAVFAAILVPKESIPHAGALATAVAILVCVLATVIVWSTNRKIEADHEVYKGFGAEYVRQCEVLGLFDEVDVSGKKESIKVRRPIGQGHGYKHTQQIVRSIGIAIGALAVFGAVFINMTQSGMARLEPRSEGYSRVDSSAISRLPELRALPATETPQPPGRR